jgi:hypothetical protein
MGRPAKKWPHFALQQLENTVVRLKELERKTSKAQDAIVLGDATTAMRDLSDVRVMALECVAELVRSRIGKYEQEGKASQSWTQTTDEQSVQAVEQVMATRRQ